MTASVTRSHHRGTRARRHRGATRLAIALFVVVVAALVPACSLSSPPKGYDVTATFSRAIGLYPNSTVRVQGISVGQVTKIRNVGDQVVVTLRVKSGTKVPADATAALVPASLLGERYVQLAPVYTGGPALQAGDEIRHTKVPAEFDELLRSLQDFTGSIDPKTASNLVTSLSSLLAGQGESLNRLIDSGAGTLQLLADKSGELGDILDSLSTLTTALQGHTGEIQKLISDYNLLAGVLSDNQGNLNTTITNTDALASEVTDLLQQHAAKLPFDVEQLTHVTRTVDRNFDSLQVLFSSTVRLFDAAGRAYDSQHNALTLNTQVSAGYTSEIIAYRLRDRISGLCRRLQIATCSDPATSPFNSIISQIPGLLGKLPGVNGTQPASTTAAATTSTPAASTTSPARASASATSGLDLSSLGLNADQRDALSHLTNDVMPVISSLSSDQLQALMTLTPEQILALGKLPVAQIPDKLNQIRAGSLAPDALLRTARPLLTGTSSNLALEGLTDSLVNALGTLGGS
ncbi:MAG TPA: MlaD family protein [Acidimicrobiales bacterium]|jgi:virulence factor Mce-like protein|nr:MlaD family protein [Acidimicrobiales bacterium]